MKFITTLILTIIFSYYLTAQFTVEFITTDAVCYGDCNGSINTNVTGGIPPYSYNWNNGEMTQNINNLCAGIYTVTVTDSTLSAVNESVSILHADSIYVSISANPDTILIGESSIITVNASGGNPPYVCAIFAQVLFPPTNNTYIAYPTVTTTYCVFCEDTLDCTSTDQCVTVYVDSVSGINENTANTECTIFPNPTTGLLIIKNEELRMMNVAVYDIYGKEVLKQEVKNQKYVVDLSNQPQGIYIIRVITDKQTITRKVIKQ